MSEARVHIRRLRLASPVTEARARGFGGRVARKVLEQLAATRIEASLDDLRVGVTRAEASDPDRLARRIVAEIRRRAR